VSLIFGIFRHLCGPIKMCHMSSVYDDVAGGRYNQHIHTQHGNDWVVTWKYQQTYHVWHDRTIQLAGDMAYSVAWCDMDQSWAATW
jgi:hypothetical protein